MAMLYIVGGGAIGSLVAAGAQKHGVPYQQYPRNVKHCPSSAVWLNGEIVTLQPACSMPSVLQADDVLVFPLKVYQLSQALHSWLPFLVNQPTVVLLHNGMGGAEIANEILGPDYPLLLATTSHGALKIETENSSVIVEYTGKGETQIGALDVQAFGRSEEFRSTLTSKLSSKLYSKLPSKLSSAISLISAALPPTHYCDDIQKALWSKLAVNAVINPLTAINNIQNKHILDSQFDKQRQAICSEFTATANAYGFSFCEKQVHERVMAVAKATGENYSSMHQDIVNKRASEIGAINGYLIERAKQKGIATPINTLLTQQIKEIEAQFNTNISM